MAVPAKILMQPDSGWIGIDGGDIPEIGTARARPVKIRATGQHESKATSGTYLFRSNPRVIPAYFDSVSTTMLKFVPKSLGHRPGYPIALGVRKNCKTTGAANPCHGLAELSPNMIDIAGFALREKSFECVRRVFGTARRRQSPGKMPPSQCASVNAVRYQIVRGVEQTGGFKLFADLQRAQSPAIAQAGQALGKRNMCGIEIQSHDVNSLRAPGDRDFHARDEPDSPVAGGKTSFPQPSHFVVVGKREGGHLT